MAKGVVGVVVVGAAPFPVSPAAPAAAVGFIKLLKNENPASFANLLFFSIAPDQSLLDQSRAIVSVANIPVENRYEQGV